MFIDFRTYVSKLNTIMKSHPLSHYDSFTPIIRNISSVDEAVNLLTSNANSSWFPLDTVIVIWEPYKLMKSNIEYVMKFSHLYVTSADTTNKCIAFSFLSIIKALKGMCVYVDYYGTTDTNIITQHLFNALNHLLQSCVFQELLAGYKEQGVRLDVLLPIQVDRKAIVDVMSKLGFENEMPTSNGHCLLVQR